jgi:SpoVK/Ycf46/Vps4 family AAA+-type ATPase
VARKTNTRYGLPSSVMVNEPVLQGQVVITMGDIGGLSPQKQLLRELVLYPLSNPSITGEMRGVIVDVSGLRVDLSYLS